MNISILGTGALGIAMAKIISDSKDAHIVMWTKFEEERKDLETSRHNERLLPGIYLDNKIEITSDLAYAISDSEVIINCLPFVAIEETAESLKGMYNGQCICSTTKGVNMETFETTTQIFSRVLGTDKVCALSGPSFAIEIANHFPISFVLAGKDEQVVKKVHEILTIDNIVIDESADVVGVQLCGAVKNAIAIGSGILHGMDSADSTQAAYLARGIKDMLKVITKFGGNPETVHTYAGIGDLILTCMSEKSRNFTCGKLIGEGNSLDEAIVKMNGKTVEGVKVIETLYRYNKEKNLNLEIIPKLYDIVFNGKDLSLILK